VIDRISKELNGFANHPYVQWQITGFGGDHAQRYLWLEQIFLILALIGGGFLTAIKRSGWQVLGILRPAIANRVLSYFAMRSALPKAIFPGLTERELDILRLMAKGNTNHQIAENLVLSPKTVSNYISNIFSKLQVADRAQAIIKAREAGVE
jgi:DNA-binding CsgD family transcriptional regulator